RRTGIDQKYREQLAEEIRQRELAEKARLEAKYPELKETEVHQHASRFDERVCEALAEDEAHGNSVAAEEIRKAHANGVLCHLPRAKRAKLLRFDITPEAADLIADALDLISPDDDIMVRLASDLAILFRQQVSTQRETENN